MQRLLSTRIGDDWVWPLLLAGGILGAMSPQMRQELLSLPAELRPPELNEQTILGVTLALGVLSGLLQAALWPALLHGAAKVLGGAAPTLRPARLAAAWSTLPILLGTLLAPLAAADTGVAELLGGLNVLLSIWSLVLLAHMLGAGYGLDPSRGALAILLGGLIGFGTAFGLSLMLLLLATGMKL